MRYSLEMFRNIFCRLYVMRTLTNGEHYNFLWIDTEHAAFSYNTLLEQLNTARMTGTASCVRVSMRDMNHVKRVLEMGPEGIIFPMINTREDAFYAMDMCFYPPCGIRGFGPLRVVRYGSRPLDEYLCNYDKELTRFIQIETVEAVKNLPEIVKEKRIDGFIFGPFDLSASLGMISKIFAPEMISLMKTTIAIIKEEGKTVGISSGTTCQKDFELWTELGINMISAGGDFVFLRESASRLLKKLTQTMYPNQNKSESQGY